MQLKKNGTVFEISLEGPIGETSPLFTTDIKAATALVLDLEKVTYMNSVGVKNWIQWTVQIKPTCELKMKNAPLMFVNQASTVRGFLPRHAVIESFAAPMICPECNTEKSFLMTVNTNYKYATPAEPSKMEAPNVKCPKCNADMETDFLIKKTATFLDRG